MAHTTKELDEFPMWNSYYANLDNLYPVPPQIQRIISVDEKYFVDKQFGKTEKLPSYFLKGQNASRVFHAERLRACIEKYNLTCLSVPRKYIYKTHNTNYKDIGFVFAVQRLIIADYIEGDETRDFSQEEVEQITLLIRKTGICDICGFGASNIIRTQTGKLVFIDTEENSFDYENREKFANEFYGEFSKK